VKFVGSDLEVGCPGWGWGSWLSSVPPDKCQNSALDFVQPTFSVHIIICTHPTAQPYNQLLKALLNKL